MESNVELQNRMEEREGDQAENSVDLDYRLSCLELGL